MSFCLFETCIRQTVDLSIFPLVCAVSAAPGQITGVKTVESDPTHTIIKKTNINPYCPIFIFS